MGFWTDLPGEDRRGKPKVRDNPTTRIKAEDARGLMRQPDRLGELLQDRGFLAGFSMRVTGGDSPITQGWGWTPSDYEVILAYGERRAGQLPEQYRRRDGLILIGIHADGMAEVATWGKDGKDCTALGEAGGIELKMLPACPFQTWWGWGNGGVPKRLDAKAYESLSPNQRTYVDRYTHPSAPR